MTAPPVSAESLPRLANIMTVEIEQCISRTAGTASSWIGSTQALMALLKACADLKNLEKGLHLHARIHKMGLLDRNQFLGSSLINMYAKCGSVPKAKEVFDKIFCRDVVSWTALISAYVVHGYSLEALHCFERMLLEGICPNSVTFVCSLKACSNMGDTGRGQILQAQIESQGLLDSNIFIGSALVDMYAKGGALERAQQVFNNFPIRNEVLWNALIAGYIEHEYNEKAIEFFVQMQTEGIIHSSVTFICILKAYGNIGATGKVVKMHARIENQRLLETDLHVGSTLVDMYAKCGFLAQAQKVFEKLPAHNVILWTTLISRCVDHGCCDAALEYFEQMKVDGVLPNAATLICILKACGTMGANEKGRETHAEIERQGLLRTDIAVGNALVDMYAKCGFPVLAEEVFYTLPIRNIVSWTALMAGYAQLSDIANVLSVFMKMKEEFVKPNLVTFVVLLRACARIGLLTGAQTYFQVMSKEYGIVPTITHHIWLADLCGRVGHFDKAVAMIGKMPFCPNPVVLKNLLSSCRRWGNALLGEKLFQDSINRMKRT